MAARATGVPAAGETQERAAIKAPTPLYTAPAPTVIRSAAMFLRWDRWPLYLSYHMKFDRTVLSTAPGVTRESFEDGDEDTRAQEGDQECAPEVKCACDAQEAG